MHVLIRKIKSLILKLARITPSFYKYLCLRWNRNTLSYWDQQYSSCDACAHWNDKIRLRFYDLVAAKLPKTPLTILDTGSGLGFGGKHLMNMYAGWVIEGLDFSSEACRNAVIKTHCVDLISDDLPGKYDYVLAVQTLEHFIQPDLILKKLYRAAKKAVIVTVPYKGDISVVHPVSFDEHSFSQYPEVEVKLNERKEVGGKVKVDMVVVLRLSCNI